MNRNCLFNKAIALLLCAVMLVGFLPSVAFGAAAEEWKPDKDEGPLDRFETTEAPTEPVGSEGYPEGTQQNPITLGADEDNSAVIEAGATKYFEYFAYSNGYLTIDFKGEGATCVLSVDGVAQDSSAVNNVKYTSGQVYAFAVSAEAETNVNFVVTFVNGWGDETSPFLMTKMDFTVTIPAGETYWYQGNLIGMNLTVTGEQGVLTYNSAQSDIASDGTTVMITTGDFFNKPMFAVGNDAESAVTYHIVAAYPAGHYTNPDKAVLGDNSVTLATPSDQGYYFDYVAEKDGDLIFTITSESNWSHNVSVGSYGENGFDASVYGENRLYAEDPAVKTLTLPVTAGQIVQIVVNAVEAEQMSYTWEGVTKYSYNTTPIAGTVSFNLAYKEEEHVHSWGDWETVTAATNTARGEAKRVCGLCGEEETKVIPIILKLRWATITMQSNLTINFKTSAEVFNEYSDIYVVFDFRGQETVLQSPGALDGENRLVFPFTGVASSWMAEDVSATIYGTFNGEVVKGETTVYSVKKYCMSQIGKGTDSVKKMYVDLLNYGSAAQLHVGYNVDNLANKDLTEEQQAYGTSTIPAMTDYQNAKYEEIENAKVAFKTVNLIFDSSVICRLSFVLNEGELDDYTIKVKTERTEWIFDKDDFVPDPNNAGRWLLNFDGMFANEMRTKFYVTAYQGETVVSNTVRYSLESYVARNYGKEGKETLSAMILGMLRYGDAVAYNYPPVA